MPRTVACSPCFRATKKVTGAEGGDVGAGLSVADTAVVMDINKGRASQLISS